MLASFSRLFATGSGLSFRRIKWGSPDYKKMLVLRDDELRKPIGLSIYDDPLCFERNIGLYGGFDGDKIVTCAILDRKSKDLFRMKQMAVSAEYQKQGIGSQMLKYLESQVLAEGGNMIHLHARKTALNFYKKNNYEVTSDVFEEVGIPHHEMRKILS